MTKSAITALGKLASRRVPTPAPKATPKAQKAPAVPAHQLSLPLWPDAVRGVPNAVLRGSLFSVSKTRPIHKNLTLLAAVEGIEVSFKGERFNQIDLDLLEALLHLARTQPVGNNVEFTSRAMLQALNRGTAGKDHEDLRNGIARLASGLIDIRWTAQNKTMGGTLVSRYYRDDETGRNVIVLNEEIVKLYDNGYTQIDWEQRMALGNNSLAKWLHGFYASHAQPYAYRVETLQRLCGSTTADLKNFRQMLRQALTHLQAIGSIKAWEIGEGDLVHVTNHPSPTQAKHLIGKAVKASKRLK